MEILRSFKNFKFRRKNFVMVSDDRDRVRLTVKSIKRSLIQKRWKSRISVEYLPLSELSH